MPINTPTQSSNLLEVLEKILDKGVVIAGDIKISLADVDLLTIKIRLLIASVDKAREIGMDWWEKDPYYSSRGRIAQEENARLYERINRLEELVEGKAALPLKTEEISFLEPQVEASPLIVKTRESELLEIGNETEHLQKNAEKKLIIDVEEDPPTKKNSSKKTSKSNTKEQKKTDKKKSPRKP